MKNKWQKIGVIGVDAGLCWVGDPCYILDNRCNKDRPKDVGKDWKGFCENFFEKEEAGNYQFNYDAGHAGLGVCVPSGYGDGKYNVYARKNDEGRIVEIKVNFEEVPEE